MECTCMYVHVLAETGPPFSFECYTTSEASHGGKFHKQVEERL